MKIFKSFEKYERKFARINRQMPVTPALNIFVIVRAFILSIGFCFVNVGAFPVQTGIQGIDNNGFNVLVIQKS